MSKNFLHGIAKEDKLPVIFEEKDGKILAFDGEGYGELTKEQVKQIYYCVECQRSQGGSGQSDIISGMSPAII